MLKPGQSFAHFKILNKLGEGGMGEVFLAEDQKLGRRVALKILTGDLFDSDERLGRFHREAKTAAQITNAYVMAIHDVGKARDENTGSDLNYIVMEFVDGRSLTEYVKEERLSLSKQVRLAEKIASGLAAAHKLNIVHRDIKPDNIIIDDSGDPKILDFGLARPLEPLQFDEEADSTQSVSQELTRAGKILGTVSYMSPEQVRGEKVDTRSDIFSFGILFYNMVTGDLPFAGPTQVETMAKILESSYEPPASKVDSIPPELERIIGKCLQKDREERYQDSRDLVVDLRNLRRQYDSGVTETVSGVTGKFDRAGRRGTSAFAKVGWAAAAVAAVLVIYMFIDKFTAGGDSTGGTRELQAKTNSLAILGFSNKTGDESLDWLETGLPEILLTDLSQNGELQLISQQRILDCLPAEKKFSHTHAECLEVARKIGTTRLLSGSFFRMDDKIRIDARLEDVATGSIILGEKVVGIDPFVLVDSLTEKIARSLGLGQMQEVATYASSPEAYKPYHLGTELFWAGQYDEAIEKFSEAIAVDSTFALPYMRIGMAHIFRGRQREGIQYFRLADQYKDRLPVRERSMLDAYTDTWANRQFDQAFTKLSSMLLAYPDDAEIRTLYALFVNVFQQDSSAAFAQLDTVLTTYPNYAFALEHMAQLHYSYENYDKAIAYNEQLRRVIPDALDPQIRLVRLYKRQDRRNEALTLAEELHQKFPDRPEPLGRLISLNICKRDFDAAREYVEIFRGQKPGDPYSQIDYFDYLTNLAVWEGKFTETLKHRNSGLEQARLTQDSTQIFAALSGISEHYRFVRQYDKMVEMAREADRWTTGLNRLNLPMTLAGAVFLQGDTSYLDEARPLMKEVIDEIKARLPKDFWHVADDVMTFFEAIVSADTSAMIASLAKLVDDANSDSSPDVQRLGELLVLAGRYQEGKERLKPFVSGAFESSSGSTYVLSQYYIGVANHELGNTEEAAENFREMLSFWGDPDMELEEIIDARERLAQLTS